MKKVDYMKPSQVKRVKITDKTKTKHGVPTFTAMVRQLNKEIKSA